MNYYLTGDTHGSFKRVEDFCKAYQTSKDDVLIILGDAGFNYYLDERDKRGKDHAASLPITLLCVHGNHEERPFNIKTYSTKQWNDGLVYYEEEYPSILFAKDGEFFSFNGKKTVVLGGAYSVDKFYRMRMGWKYFPSEIPTKEMMDEAERNLSLNGWEVDYVLSHTVPLKYEPTEFFIRGLDQTTVDKTVEIWLESIEEKLNYKHWYAGHYHHYKDIDKLTIMFTEYKLLC